MSSTPIPFVPSRPAYRYPADFLGAMGAIGASGVLVRGGGRVRLDFEVPVERRHRAEVLIGDRTTWSADLWEGCVATAALLIPGGASTFAHANDGAHSVDLASLVPPPGGGPATVLSFRISVRDVGTPAALFEALREIGGEIMLRRDQHGLSIGFAASHRREMRLDVLLGRCAAHGGTWWLRAVFALEALFPAEDSLWGLEPGEVLRLPLAEAVDLATASRSMAAP